MHNAHKPSVDELPSTRQLVRSTAIALVAAFVILITTVLPAEYAIDPTGIGRVFGLTQMGQIKIQFAKEASKGEVTVAKTESAKSALVETTKAPLEKSDEITITLMSGLGKEVKVEMLKGKRVNYRWSVSGGVLNYDKHGEPYNASRYYSHSYSKGRGASSGEGTLEAEFDGHHGWYWFNPTSKVLKITLWVKGEYIKLKRL